MEFAPSAAASALRQPLPFASARPSTGPGCDDNPGCDGIGHPAGQPLGHQGARGDRHRLDVQARAAQERQPLLRGQVGRATPTGSSEVLRSPSAGARRTSLREHRRGPRQRVRWCWWRAGSRGARPHPRDRPPASSRTSAARRSPGVPSRSSHERLAGVPPRTGAAPVPGRGIEAALAQAGDPHQVLQHSERDEHSDRGERSRRVRTSAGRHPESRCSGCRSGHRAASWRSTY